MRALFQAQSNHIHNGAYVFVAKNPITQTPYDKLQKEFLFSLRKLKTIKSWNGSHFFLSAFTRKY